MAGNKRSIIPYKAGIRADGKTGFRVKPGMMGAGGRKNQQLSGILQMHDRGDNHLDKEKPHQPDNDHHQNDNINPVELACPVILCIIKNLFAAGAAPVGTLLTDKRVAANTGQLFGGKRIGHGFNSFSVSSTFSGFCSLKTGLSIFWGSCSLKNRVVSSIIR